MAKDNKREQILNALEQLLPGRRFHEITLDEVSRAAQVGKGTIYLYFQDKDALFVEMVCFRLEKLSDELSLLSGCSINELPGRVFELVGDFIRRHHSWFGTGAGQLSGAARITGEQQQQVKIQSQKVIDTLANVMHGAVPGWSREQAQANAQALLWLIDGCCRSEMAECSVPPSEFLSSFFLRGAGISL